MLPRRNIILAGGPLKAANGAAISNTNKPAAQSSILLVSYEAANDTFRTRAANDGPEKNDLQPLNDGRYRCLNQAAQADNTRGQSTTSGSLAEMLIGGDKANRLLRRLLFITLFTSIINTLLLSFTIGSLRLSDKGLMNGKINWDERIMGSVFELPTKLPGKSIQLNSIESYWKDKPLVLQYFGLSPGNPQTSPVKQEVAHNRQHRVGDKPASVFLRSESRFQEAIEYSSTMAVRESKISDNCYGHSREGLLKISAELFALDLINENSEQEASTVGQKKYSGSVISTATTTVTPSTGRAGDDNQTSSPLLELDGHKATVTLFSQSRLRTSPASFSSFKVDGQVRCREISGSLSEYLDIQTHSGDLSFRSGDQMKLISKSAAIKITSFEDVVAKAPSITFNANELYLASGVDYFDSIDLKRMAQLRDDKLTTKSAERLRAYNLVTINGMLMAA